MLSQHDVSSWRGARAAGRHGFLFVILCVCLQSTSINARQLCTSPNAEGNKIFFRGIREDQVVGTDLGTLNIVGSESEISLVEDSTIWDDHIAYHDDGRRLSVVAQLDKDQGGNGRIQLQLSCQVRATGSQVPVPIEILLQDVNDNPPEFEEDTYVTNVSETVPIGTVIFNNIRAFDNDDSNWYVNYAIVPGQYSSYFRMPSEATGKIELAQPLDYERERTINFYVLGRDNHLTDGVLSDVHLTSSVLVTVNVLDGDDQNPQFDSSHYTATLLETSNINDLVQVTPSIRAFDPDVNINSDIEYSFVDDLFSSDTDYFSINPTDGTISVQRIPLLRGTRFALTVKATKLTRSDRFSTALLRIFVTAAPENPPIFSRDVYEASIVENTPQDIFVVNVHATDNDVGFEQGGSSLEDTEGAILLYSFAEGDQDASHFTINPTTGDILTATTLDFEEFRVYELIVEVTDSIETDQAIVRISVLNLNDNFPRFGEDSYFFEGHASNGYDIGSVTAIDADPDSNINYSLLDNFDGLFGIDMSSGELIFHGDEVQQKEYRLSVLASDSGDPPLHGIALVTVTFDVEPAAVTGGGGGGGVSVVVPIILGILAGVLLIIIIIMVLYIYRHIHSTNMNRFVKSSSFESQLHMNKSLSTSSNLYSSEALVFQNNNSRHLDIYNQIDAPPADGTPQQENPFVPDTSYDPNNPNNTIPSSRRVGRGVYVIDGTTESSSDQDHTAQNQMAGVNEIEYNTAITPMGTYRRTSGTGSTPYTNGSVPSSTMSVVGSSLSTFREPSRLSLKTDTPSKRGRSQNMTPPPPPPPQFTSPPLDGVSFIDSYQSDVYPTNPQNTDHHSSLSSNEPDRPGITVYY